MPMTLRSMPWWVWLIPIAFLAVAVADMSLTYYTFNRLIVFTAAAIFGIFSWDERGSGRLAARFGTAALALVAIVFNPMFVLPLTREMWIVCDVAAIAIFAAHLYFVRLGKTLR